jgi:hypothetical protein
LPEELKLGFDVLNNGRADHHGRHRGGGLSACGRFNGSADTRTEVDSSSGQTNQDNGASDGPQMALALGFLLRGFEGLWSFLRKGLGRFRESDSFGGDFRRDHSDDACFSIAVDGSI